MKTSASEIFGGLVRERLHARVRRDVCLAVCVGLLVLACHPGVPGWGLLVLLVEMVIGARGAWLEHESARDLTEEIEEIGGAL